MRTLVVRRDDKFLGLRGAKYWKTKLWGTRSQGPRYCCRYFRYRRYLRYFRYFRYFRYLGT